MLKPTFRLAMPVRSAFVGLVLGDPLLAAGRSARAARRVGAVAGADEAAVAGRRAGSRRRAPARAGRECRRTDRAALRAAASSALVRPVSLALTFGKHASVRPTKLRSRGLARPVVTRAKQPLEVVDLLQRLAQAAR